MSFIKGNGSFRQTVSKYIKDTSLSLIERAYEKVSGKKIGTSQPDPQQFDFEPQDFCYVNGEYRLLSEVLSKYENGYFTGAFDIVHDGHVRQIQKAAAVCQKLFVGVSTDEVVLGYKFAQTAMPYGARSYIIQGIKGVHQVVPQTDLYDKMTPCEQYGIDVILTSDEYLRSTYGDNPMSEKERLGVERWETFQEEANAKGIDVIYLPRAQSLCKSSSNIKKTIIANQNVEKGDMEVIVPADTVPQTDAEIELINWGRAASYDGPPAYSEGENYYEDICQ